MRIGTGHRRLPARRSRATPRTPAFRPALEKLEDRCVPSTNTGAYHVTNLVSDQPGVALIQDTNLVNGWGISLNPAAGAFWVSANETGKATLYRGDVSGSAFVRVSLVVTIPDGLPTGQVFNGTSDFVIGGGSAAVFIFASQAGDITAWNSAQGTTAALMASVPDAVYTGLAIGSVGTANFLYAANFANNSIDVFNKDFSLQSAESFPFSDPNLPPNYSPFNIQNLGGKLYVAYAQQDHANPDEETDHGAGFVDVFDTSGHLLQRLVKGNHLAAPWGLAIAPSDFGPFSNALLVGNFGNGHINAFDVGTGKFLGKLRDETGKPIVIDGLWGITFGNGVSAGDKNALYFAAGPDDETHGLFGSVRFVNDSASAASIDATAVNALFASAAPNVPPDAPATTSKPASAPVRSSGGPSAAGPSLSSFPPLSHASDRALEQVLETLFAEEAFPPIGGLRNGMGR